MAVFLRKEREWGSADGERGGGKGRGGKGGGVGSGTANIEADGVIEDGGNSVQLAFPEVISDLDEIHHVGTLAQVYIYTIQCSVDNYVGGHFVFGQHHRHPCF